ncbi:MAG: hypothetical protein P1U58_03420 [Verrucomicrobiales bacterium]|nr:hypothetical protein [Verrucomicrobiales bacterium]
MKSGLLALLITSFTFISVPPIEGGQTASEPRIFKVRTCEIDRSSYKKWAYDRSGNRYSYRVTVITYKDVYSNGSFRIRKETES